MNTTQEPEKRRRQTHIGVAKVAIEVAGNREAWQLRSNHEGVSFIPSAASDLGVSNDIAAGIMETAGVTFVRKVQPTQAEREARAAKPPDLAQELRDTSIALMTTINNQTSRLDGRLDAQGTIIAKAEGRLEIQERIAQGHLGRINEHQEKLNEHWQLLQGIGETQTHLGSENRTTANIARVLIKRIEDLEASVAHLTGKSMEEARRCGDLHAAFQQLTSRIIKLEQDQA